VGAAFRSRVIARAIKVGILRNTDLGVASVVNHLIAISAYLTTNFRLYIIVEVVSGAQVATNVSLIRFRTVEMLSAHTDLVEVSSIDHVFTGSGVVLNATSVGHNQCWIVTDARHSGSIEGRTIITLAAFEAVLRRVIAVWSPHFSGTLSTLTIHRIRLSLSKVALSRAFIDALITLESNVLWNTLLLEFLSPAVVDLEFLALRIKSMVVDTVVSSHKVLSAHHADSTIVFTKPLAFT